ncbi:hypothetical protein ACE04B_17475, partial [Rhizobium phaseoli]
MNLKFRGHAFASFFHEVECRTTRWLGRQVAAPNGYQETEFVMMFKSEKKMRAALSVLAVMFGAASAPV